MSGVCSLSGHHQAQQLLRACENNTSLSMVHGQCEKSPLYSTGQDGHTIITELPLLNTTRGTPIHTGRSLDTCINSSQGEGWYLLVQDADERQLAQRCASLHPNSDGMLCAGGSNYPVIGEGGSMIEVPADSVQQEIKQDGKVVSLGRDGKYTVIGTIVVSRWVNEQGLLPVENNCFLPTDAAGDQTIATPGESAPSLIPGHLEKSNVDLEKQMRLAKDAETLAKCSFQLQHTDDQINHDLPARLLIGGA
jgi:flagellar basal body rod protein FlgG